MITFGERIRELRREAGLTQWDVANRTGVSNTYISALESGRKPAPPHVIVTALASCLQTSEETLWALARAEREERLKRRIDGVPTSQRIARTANAVNNSINTMASADPLEQAIQTLRDSATNSKQRHSLARALETLAESLRR